MRGVHSSGNTLYKRSFKNQLMVRSPLAERERPHRAPSIGRTGNLGEQAYQLIRAEILFFQIPPGCRISEASLTKRFNLRQAAVRSALLRLMQEGLVDKADERNLRVAPLTLKDVQDIYGLRILLEPPAAEMAAGIGMAEVDLERLRRICQSSYELTSHNQLVEFLSANRDFNLTIASAAGNSRLVAAITSLQDLTLRILYIGIRSLNVSDWFQSTHLQIIDALAARESARVSELWVTDLRYGARIISDALIKLPEVSGTNLGGSNLILGDSK
jgi:DNA-binding GntR family transcriptional regulator